MDQQELINFKQAKARAEEYEQGHWKAQFAIHGIGERYFDKWLFNFRCISEIQKQHMETIQKLARRNSPMAFLGNVGNGKTHLAIAILKDAIILDRTGRAGHYFTLSDLHRDFRDAQNNSNRSEKGFFENISSMKCLVIDELQIKSDSDSEQRMLQEVIDKRYSANRQTVFVGNMSISGFKSLIGERLVDRGREQGLEILVFKDDSYRDVVGGCDE